MSDERVAWLHDYLALIAQERNARPAEAMLADEIEALRAVVAKQADRLEDCKRFVGADRVAVLFDGHEFVAYLAALPVGDEEADE